MNHCNTRCTNSSPSTLDLVICNTLSKPMIGDILLFDTGFSDHMMLTFSATKVKPVSPKPELYKKLLLNNRTVISIKNKGPSLEYGYK